MTDTTKSVGACPQCGVKKPYRDNELCRSCFMPEFPHIEIQKIERVVRETFVTIGDDTFLLNDLLETLDALDDDSIYVTNDSMARMLLRLAVIKGNSSSWGASKGPNFKRFHEAIRKMFHAEDEE